MNWSSDYWKRREEEQERIREHFANQAGNTGFGQSYFSYYRQSGQSSGPEPDFWVLPDGRVTTNRREWKAWLFAQHYGGGRPGQEYEGHFTEEDTISDPGPNTQRAYHTYQQQRDLYERWLKGHPGDSYPAGEPKFGDHDGMNCRTFLGNKGWVDDEELARGKCWRCLVGNAHLKDMCEPWKFPDEPEEQPQYWDIDNDREWSAKLIYSYDLVIPDEALELGVEDGAFVITRLDRVIGTDIALVHDER